MEMYSFSSAAATKCHKLGDLNNWYVLICIASQFWGPEVWDQDAGRVDSLWGMWGKDLSCVFFVASGGLLAIFGIPWLVPWHHPDLCLYLIWHSPCVYVLWVQIPLFMSCLDCKEIKPVNPKGNQPWMFIGRTDAEAPILWPPDMKSRLTGKDWKNAGKDWRQKEKGMAEDEMVGWHYPLNDTNLSKLWEIVEDRGAWHTVHRVPKSWT